MHMATYQYVKVAVEDRTAILTIDHPPANAFNTQPVMDLEKAFSEVSSNPEVKTIIITTTTAASRSAVSSSARKGLASLFPTILIP